MDNNIEGGEVGFAGAERAALSERCSGPCADAFMAMTAAARASSQEE